MIGLERFELPKTGGLKDSKASDNESTENHAPAPCTVPGYLVCPDLTRVVTAWEKIPSALKAAILNIIATVEGDALKGNRS
jgi:hypothetical protein